jgi:hypothetical protein
MNGNDTVGSVEEDDDVVLESTCQGAAKGGYSGDLQGKEAISG